jgi:hypothetical protein
VQFIPTATDAIRNEFYYSIMSADGKCTDPADEFSGNECSAIEESAAPTYNLQILLHMQDIFRHLSDNQLKYYAPKGIWEDYRMN